MQHDNYIEDILKNHFQKNIKLLLNDEELKSGKFLLYKLATYSNNFYIEFHIKREKKNDLVKIPYPFKVEEHLDDGLIYFDYRLNTLLNNNTQLTNKIYTLANQYPDSANNKFFDKILEIQFT